MSGSIDNTWPADRKAFWVAVVDLTLPLAPIFWELADLGAALIARLAMRGRARPTPPALESLVS
jgi:hypothetical protein